MDSDKKQSGRQGLPVWVCEQDGQGEHVPEKRHFRKAERRKPRREKGSGKPQTAQRALSSEAEITQHIC